jgi:serine phosphatase RsbU (regulator of sigma subunit)
MGDYKQSLKYHFEFLNFIIDKKNKPAMAVGYGNVGLVYHTLKDFEKAEKYINKSIELYLELKNEAGLSRNYGNLGNIYEQKNNDKKALIYYNKALEIDTRLENKLGVARHLGNIGLVYKNINENDKAISFLSEALAIDTELGNKSGIVRHLTGIGAVYINTKEYDKAEIYLKRANKIAVEIKNPTLIMDSEGYLSDLYRLKENYKEALNYYRSHTILRDSLISEENTKMSLQRDFQLEYEKKNLKDSIDHAKAQEIKDIKINNQQTEIKAKRNQQYLLFGGIILILIFTGFLFNRFRITSQQKLIIEEKNHEILDSIIYAKRIQNAILPPAKIVKQHLKDNFILYKPKDIVAGDFYWMETVSVITSEERTKQSAPNEEIASLHKSSVRNDDIVLFAAADCTGHGVPGAMVSVVCNNGLNRSVREYGLTDPGEILDKTREIVIQEFEKSEEDVKDGMDIALCSLKQEDGSWKLKYAGAHNPLWIITNCQSELVEDSNNSVVSILRQAQDETPTLLEIKANKQPIGQFDNPAPYTTHTITLQKGDSIYIFSDGYADQFGGDKGKKLKTVNFKQLLLSIQKEPMEKQKQLIDEAFETWKGDLEQVDDVCIIGVKF